MKRWWMALAITAWAARMATADAGVLVPAGHTQPDSAIFSLHEMTDNGLVRATEQNLR